MRNLLLVFALFAFVGCNSSPDTTPSNTDVPSNNSVSADSTITPTSTDTPTTDTTLLGADTVVKTSSAQSEYTIAPAYTTDTFKVHVNAWLASKSMNLDYVNITITNNSGNTCPIYGNDAFYYFYRNEYLSYATSGGIAVSHNDFLNYIYCIQDQGFNFNLIDNSNNSINNSDFFIFSNANTKYYRNYYSDPYTTGYYTLYYFDYILNPNESITIEVFIDNFGTDSASLSFEKTSYYRNELNSLYAITDTPTQ